MGRVFHIRRGPGWAWKNRPMRCSTVNPGFRMSSRLCLLFLDDKKKSPNNLRHYLTCFYVSQALLVALACVVHYDLLGLFLAHSYGRRIVYSDNEQHQYRPRSEFDHIWIPRPGTDPNTLYLVPRPVTLPDHGGRVEDYWTDTDDVVKCNDRGNAGGKLCDGEVHRREPAPDTAVVDRVHTTTTAEEPDDRDQDDDDYVAPGQEWDDDVFWRASTPVREIFAKFLQFINIDLVTIHIT